MIRTVCALVVLGALASDPGDVVIDEFESTAGWKTTPSDGVALSVSEDAGFHGKSMRLDFDFHGHGGYAVIHKDVKVTVPANYEFSFSIRGESPVNTLEFKLIDPSGDNVWWSNQTGFVFPAQWKHVTRKKRQISFAWGPLGGGDLRNVAAIEFAITAGAGGKGSVWLDDLRLTPLPAEGPYALKPKLQATSIVPGHTAEMALDTDPSTSWRAAFAGTTDLDIDFLKRREFGGLVLDWERGRRPESYAVSTSIDGSQFTRVYEAGTSTSSRDYLYLPESDARYVRLSAVGKAAPVGLKEITVEPLTWSASMNDFLTAVAHDGPSGDYPRYFANRQSYWTVIGVNGDTREGLMDTRGMLESGKAQFSIEPFLRTGSRLTTWADVTARASDAGGDLPIPSVTWTASPLGLTVTAFASGPAESSVLFGSYRVHNPSGRSRTATLYLAIRPFQVNPPWQFLNTPGGFARIDSISFDGRKVRVNSDRVILPVSHPVLFGAAAFTQGSLIELLRKGVVPAGRSAADNLGLASGVLSYNLHIGPHADTTIYVAIPLHQATPACAGDPYGCTADWASSQLRLAKSTWTTDLGRVRIQLPPSAQRITQSIRSNLAYILINRDGPAIQPGSRSYERSWIRDGSLTSAALLRLGHEKEVKDFLEWYAGFQFANGKIPCCVDSRGSDPVPENDSHGEFIYLVAEYFRHTGDRVMLEKMWPHVSMAVAFMDSLRLSRKTPEFEQQDKHVFYGLLPQSISHEGYSAKPMHSYWDDFFALRGYRDAAEIARILGKPETAHYATARDEFTSDLRASVVLAMKNHRIDFIPGAAELGDFDATSTTVGVNPGGELGGPLDARIRATFARYYSDFVKRRESGKWEAYTPYEWRTVGTFIRMGERQHALDLIDFFFQGQRPKQWHQWAEVVWENGDTARFIGDMPHTWVGSDFIRSALDMFAYERDSDSSLVIAAGIPASWLRDGQGIRIEGLSTHYGKLSYSMRAVGSTVDLKIESRIRVPDGGIIVQPPMAARPREIIMNGSAVPVSDQIRITTVPAALTIRY